MLRSGMIHKNGKKYLLSLAVMAALALVAGDAAAQQQGLGDVIDRTATSFSSLSNVLSVIAYICGLTLGVSAIFKLKEHVGVADRPGASPTLSDVVKRFLAAGSFLAAPYLGQVVYNTFFGGGDKISVTGRSGGTASGDGLDAMVVRLMTDIGGPVENLLVVFCYLSGIVFLLVGISRLTKRAEDGPRGPAGMGTIFTFLTAGALFAFGDMMGAFSSSLFGDSQIATRASIVSSVGMDNEDAARVQTVIEAVMAFIMIVGFIAFIRGWFVLNSFAHGQNGATLAQGLTFLFGGALAINLGELVNVIQESVGVSGITFS